jgi:hypothetical protein
MSVFARQRETAKRLIVKNGQAVVWRSLSNGAPADTAQPWKPGAGSNVDSPVSIVFLPENRLGYEWIARLANTDIPEGSGFGLMHYVSFVPTLKDTVTKGGENLRVVSIDPLAPNGEVILYVVRLAQ